MKYNCLNGNVIIRPITEKVTTKAGLVVSATEQRGKKDIICGEIVISNRKDCLKVGNIIYYPMFAAQPINFDGFEGFAVNAKDIILVLVKDAEAID
jgi:co-chaperonin GroES (HSP10)